MDKLFSVAIDGPSAAGKSTIAKAISQTTGALYLDTGAMYRAVGLYMLRRGIDPWDAAAVRAAIDGVVVRVTYLGGAQRVFLFDEDVSDAVRAHSVSDAASAVSAVPEVRTRLVQMQREIAAGQRVVMDGRDIGTHVLPDATLKIFLVAAPEVRARRRYLELQARGSSGSFEEVLRDLIERDHNDSTRAASPLEKSEGAFEIDSSELSVDEVVDQVIELLERKTRG